MQKLRRLCQLILIIIGLPLVAACGKSEEPKVAAPSDRKTEVVTTSAPTTQPASPEALKAILRERVEKYWAARQSRDVRTLYELESAAQPGGWLKLENAMSLLGLPVRNVKILEVRIDGERAMTSISGEVAVGTLGWTPQTLKDYWVLIDGQWYHETSR
jgi:hypothetical protein